MGRSFEKSAGPGGLSSESRTSPSVTHSLYTTWSLHVLSGLWLTCLEPSPSLGLHLTPAGISLRFPRGRGKGSRSLQWGNWEQAAGARRAWNLVSERRTRAPPPLGRSLLVPAQHTPQGLRCSNTKTPHRKPRAIPGAQSPRSLEPPSCLRKKQRGWLGFPCGAPHCAVLSPR